MAPTTRRRFARVLVLLAAQGAAGLALQSGTTTLYGPPAHQSSTLTPATPIQTSMVPTSTKSFSAALLFDCDGVLVETEEYHRLAYNEAFRAFGLTIDGAPVEWSVAYYDTLQNTVGGGKPKMRYHFTQTAKQWPSVNDRPTPKTDEEGSALIDALQDRKTEAYKRLVTEAKPRPGILELMDAAIATENLAVGICSASTRGGFERVVNAVVGAERLAKLDVVIAGDDVDKKKPDPEIYTLAATRLGFTDDPSLCVVVEDSLVGLKAATAAGMRCVITYTSSTKNEDFYGAGAAATLLDFAHPWANLGELFDLGAVDDLRPRADILARVRD